MDFHGKAAQVLSRVLGMEDHADALPRTPGDKLNVG